MYNKAILISSANVIIDRPPAALAFLAGICDHNNLDYEIFDLNVFIRDIVGEEIWRQIEVGSAFMEFVFEDTTLFDLCDRVANLAADKLLSCDPDLVTITSLSSHQISWTNRILQAIRERSSATIIAGGPGISYEQKIGKTAGKILAEKNLLDYYVLGEGDYVFDNFLKGKIDTGVNHKDDLNEVWVPQIDNLDNVILPTYKKVNFSNYGLHVNGFKLPPTINITGSRGCIRRCTFCDVGHLWKKFRFRSAESVVSEIVKHFHETGCIEYFFNDSLINGSLKQFREVMVGMSEIKEQLKDLQPIRYSGQFILRPKEHHPESIFQLMKSSGCNHIQLGIESGSERVREHMGKKFSNDDIAYHFEMCNKYGIKNMIFMMVGYPTETVEDFQDTLDFYKTNQKYLINDIIIGTNIAAPTGIYNNTPLHNMSNELGIEIHDAEYVNMSNWTISSNPELTVKARYKRFLELATLTTELGYPKGTDELVFLEMNAEEIKKEIKRQSKPKVILLREEK
jgi:radical SAM superfamily enzyme YgiQ (UPF0313 family)